MYVSSKRTNIVTCLILSTNGLKNFFSFVIADDYRASTYYPLMAKKCGYAHLDTFFITVVHGPVDWLLKIQEERYSNQMNKQFPSIWKDL